MSIARVTDDMTPGRIITLMLLSAGRLDREFRERVREGVSLGDDLKAGKSSYLYTKAGAECRGHAHERFGIHRDSMATSQGGKSGDIR